MASPTLELSELDAKIGRLFMAGLPGVEMDKDTEALIRDYGLGGLILFSRNIQDPLQLAELCLHLQDCAMKCQGVPLFLAVDQEGGTVARLVKPFRCFPGNEVIGADPRPLERAKEFAAVTAREMTLVGLNMDLAPVVDVRRGEPEKHLAGRTFSDDPELVSVLGSTVVRVLQEHGVMAVAKHFPGLGKTALDPHHRLPIIPLQTEELERIDLPPFIEAINVGVSSIMTSHAVYPVLDPNCPATVSKEVLTGILRERLHFDGLIITDDLEMGAISEHWEVQEAAVAAFEAGADLLLICKSQEAVLDAMQVLKKKLMRGEISLRRLQESEQRIISTKTKFLGRMKKVSLQHVRTYFSSCMSFHA